MAATREDISRWFDNPYIKGATHMIVVCDTFDWEDFPVYVAPGEDARARAKSEGDMTMQKVMEVYNLSMDKATQMAQHRAFNY